MKRTVSYENMPVHNGKVCIFPEIVNGKNVNVVIIGNTEGLEYLGELILYFAKLDQIAIGVPEGERAHAHLNPGVQLGKHSCAVEICRADARGSAQLPEFMNE